MSGMSFPPVVRMVIADWFVLGADEGAALEVHWCSPGGDACRDDTRRWEVHSQRSVLVMSGESDGTHGCIYTFRGI